MISVAVCEHAWAWVYFCLLRVISFDVMSLLHILDGFRGKMLQLLRQSLLPESLAKRNIVKHRCKLQTCKLCFHHLTTDSLWHGVGIKQLNPCRLLMFYADHQEIERKLCKVMLAKARLIQEQSSNDTHHSEANDLAKPNKRAKYATRSTRSTRYVRYVRYVTATKSRWDLITVRTWRSQVTTW